MAVPCASTFEANSVALRRGCLTKNAHFNPMFCSDEAIRRSLCPIRYCMEKPKRTHTHTHMRRGLMIDAAQ